MELTKIQYSFLRELADTAEETNATDIGTFSEGNDEHSMQGNEEGISHAQLDLKTIQNTETNSGGGTIT